MEKEVNNKTTIKGVQSAGREFTTTEHLYPSSFATFLHAIEDGTIKWDTTTTTANGDLIISQGERNKLRAEGLNAFEEDLRAWASRYDVDVTRSKDGFCLIAEGDDFTFSWEIKCSIKALSYDPFIEANAYEEELALKANKKKKGSTTTNREQKRQEWYEHNSKEENNNY